MWLLPTRHFCGSCTHRELAVSKSAASNVVGICIKLRSTLQYVVEKPLHVGELLTVSSLGKNEKSPLSSIHVAS